MSDLYFDDVFRVAMGDSLSPYAYQSRLACGPDATPENIESLRRGTQYRSLLINIPTGLGKTAAVVLAWLWNRILHPDSSHRDSWPRRLVYCLPMRTLVEQTRDAAKTWLQRVAKEFAQNAKPEGNELAWLAANSPVILMGGEAADVAQARWDIWPEKPALLIGTQDMLLSRALNRGYGMSRYRWPMHFGLLNNDCLWVFDEIQLMGSGLATTAQLEAFREKLGQNRCASFWISATLRRDWLKTVDFVDPSKVPLVTLDERDFQTHEVRERREARKPVKPANASMDDSSELATELFKAHQNAGEHTLVVVNTVKRARDLAQQLQRVIKSAEPKPEIVLIHSRFRPDDRSRCVGRLLAEPGEHGMIVVSTQVVEAGVDVSARTLFTELAPWASLVQRFGRCNRGGKENDKAQVFWIDLPADNKQHAKVSPPYETSELLKSRELLQKQKAVGPASLPEDVDLSYQRGQVLRYNDFVELFDTTPDLAGNDIDIERYVREVEECDVQVFWRDWPTDQPPPNDMSGPRRDELCAAPVGEFRNFASDPKRRKLVYRWDYLDERWLSVDTNRIFPGQIYLLHATAGGYTPEFGWDAKSSEKVIVLEAQPTPQLQSYDADRSSQSGWQSISEHTDYVYRELEVILSELEIVEAEALRLAARWHDRGKAHPAFVAKLKPEALAAARAEQLFNGDFPAKAPADAWVHGRNQNPDYRKHFRHELASALATLMVEHHQIASDVRDLVAYLIAAHHGKVRLSIRSLAEEIVPPDNRRFARGIWDNDELPFTELGGAAKAPSVKISLELMELGLCEQPPLAGRPSWADRMLRLRDDPRLGPFHLTYLEAILRAADGRASTNASYGKPT
jgi:CRISPR-associated endonuclease/helicase Cas3